MSAVFSQDVRDQVVLPKDSIPKKVTTLSKQFQILGRLGEGGMGKVFKAFDPIMNRYVALKMIKIDVPDSERRRFRQEARFCGNFSHPSLVRVLDVGTTQELGLFWFAMEFLEGRDIQQLLDAGETLPLPHACELFSQILSALHYIGLRGIVHRDIKPANIFITTDKYEPEVQTAKLLDFGVAKDLNDKKPEDEKLILGDPRYMPMEQAVPNGPIDTRADLYALGMTFFEAVTGHHPFEDLAGQHPREWVRAHRNRIPPPPSNFLPSDTPIEAARAIDSFFELACGKQPDQRFSNARAMQAALSELRRYC